jgi:hypothetical protein
MPFKFRQKAARARYHGHQFRHSARVASVLHIEGDKNWDQFPQLLVPFPISRLFTVVDGERVLFVVRVIGVAVERIRSG